MDLGADLRPLPPSFEQIRTHRVTHYCGAPIVHSMLADAPNQSGIAHQISSLLAGAAPPLTVFECMADIGVALTHMYGLTETYGPAVVCTPQPAWDALSPYARVECNSRLQGKPACMLRSQLVQWHHQLTTCTNNLENMELIDRIPGAHGRVGKRTVKDQISDKLAYMIHSGLLRAGDELPSERALATTLEVSRETVRAAIGVLHARRMVEVSQGARTKVIGAGLLPMHESVSTLGSLKERSFEEVAEARAAVELQVIRFAAQRITDNGLARLSSLVKEQELMLKDPVGFQISDREFHTTLYKSCGNSLLVDVVSDFYDYALEYRRRALQRPGAIKHSVQDHKEIVDALKTRNPDAAVAAMRGHLERVRETTMKEMVNRV
ncbi:FadR/GntR family transcriptional regulator [Verminephrobacter eiseniae]|uniref:Transcriptional regulator, GntR family n=1 Tax=Verminephrobacter eiseniae (strain EF01-2) TaxID=391735 RepID=A1WLF1_VEREI|nr:FadR/GntR family transcriptional regulator [Verminephrobacter eiseniae]ABM58458.1 transcriptional regulator, GntR family [Verminephrobacter eiseniae EF01-2]MCW5284034.1 FCD domain-containing protein [Verminephrobacter eiseniae]MCW5301742.1 FCD domain-containing protein [Verminephrobacter eiseniae]MCW8178993.1 FCD domain-containing protein [Verminephrobacter eiseniae]MCW8189556.1 FCD domain-containing protein [Verminephrobacter eiseniae]